MNTLFNHCSLLEGRLYKAESEANQYLEGDLFADSAFPLNFHSVASEVFEDDNCSSLVSEEDSETQSISSFSSGQTSPLDLPAQFLPVARPRSLDLSSPISLSEFGIFPLLGPRSECSGASSPECEIERGMFGLVKLSILDLIQNC